MAFHSSGTVLSVCHAHSSMALKVPGQGRVQKGRPVSSALLDVASEHGGGAPASRTPTVGTSALTKEPEEPLNVT